MQIIWVLRRKKEMMNKTRLMMGLALLGVLAVAPAISWAQTPVTLQMNIPASLTVTVDCDGIGGNQVVLAFNAVTKIGTGSCTTVNIDWLQTSGTNLRTTATLTTALAAGITIPAADHEIKISGNTFGDTTAVTVFTALSAPINIWEEAVAAGEQNRADAFSLDFRVDASALLNLEPGIYNGQVDLTVSTF